MSAAPQPRTVTDLLIASREAHQRYHVASGEVYKDGRMKRYPHEEDRLAAIQDALDARMAAEAMDPEHTDPAWADDLTVNQGVSSSDLLRFYTDFLSARPAVLAARRAVNGGGPPS